MNISIVNSIEKVYNYSSKRKFCNASDAITAYDRFLSMGRANPCAAKMIEAEIHSKMLNEMFAKKKSRFKFMQKIANVLNLSFIFHKLTKVKFDPLNEYVLRKFNASFENKYPVTKDYRQKILGIIELDDYNKNQINADRAVERFKRQTEILKRKASL